MKIELVRRALLAPIVLLASCGAAPSNDPAEGEAWLSQQYFGDREVATLPDLAQSRVFDIELWRRTGASGDAPKDEAFSYRVMLSHYFPETTFGEDLGKIPQHRFTDPAQILDTLKADRSEVEAIVGAGKVRLAAIHLVSGMDVSELAKKARDQVFDVKYYGSRCIIMDSYGPKMQNKRTEIFLSGKGDIWDLNDPVVERCMVGGIAATMGMNTRYVMSHADRLYPHAPARWPCAFAASGPRAREFLDELSFAPCRSGARYTWPYGVLRAAVRSGSLPPGPIRREAFDAALANAARTLGGAVRERAMREDAEALAAARAAPKTLPPVVPGEAIAPRRM